MKYTSENNWYSWNYDDAAPFGRRGDTGKQFKTHFSKFSGKIGTVREELLNAARSTLDHYPGLRPSVFFSGGVDSEMIVRAYMEIGANPEVFIVEYENELNAFDTIYAKEICKNLKIDYKIINFDILKFFENDAEKVSDDAEIDRPRMLPHLKFTENVDGLIIVGHSDVRYYRPHDDYSVRATWLAQDFEHDIGCDKYNILHSRPAIYQWWKWTPGLVLSFTNLQWFQELVSDKIPGKLGTNSTKAVGFREIYPDLVQRKKYTGFELIDPVIDEFQKFLYHKHGDKLPYRAYIERTIDQLWHEICGISYAEALNKS